MGKAKYPKYKPSKALWQEQIPSHWQETELRMFFADNKNKNIGLVERNLLSLSYGKLKRKDIDDATGLVPASFEGYQIIEKGYIILRFTDLQNDKKSLRVGYANERGIITNAYIGLAPKTDIHSKYFYYQLHFLDKIKYFYNLGGGVRQSLAFKEFGREMILAPEKTEQIRIANFLDYKLLKVERFIRKKKELIKLLNEKKSVIITKAITKGIDNTVPMKDSKIEWLGKIPLSWKVKRIKYLGKAVIGLTYSPSDETDSKNGTLVLRSSNVQNGKITYDDCVYVSTKIPYNKTTRKGDILICSRNGSIKLIGKNALIDEKASGITFGAFMTIFRTQYYEYLHYFFNSFSFKAQSGLFSTSTINQLTTGILNNILIALPETLEEQLKIVDFIKKETKIIESAISVIEKEISLTEEYKTAIIAEAITGKIDVKNYAFKNVEEDSYEESDEELSIAAEDNTEYETISE
jgi:type I restriction enzyme S subunit